MNIGLAFNCKKSCDRQGNIVKQGLLLFLPSPSINRHTEFNVAITIWCYVLTAKTINTITTSVDRTHLQVMFNKIICIIYCLTSNLCWF